MSNYPATAYNSQKIPDQPKPIARSGLKKFGQIALPWGNTQAVTPKQFFQGASPSSMKESIARGVYDDMATCVANKAYGLDAGNNAIDQQKIRYSPMALHTRLLAIGYGVSKFLTFFWGGISLLSIMMIYFVESDVSRFRSIIDIAILCWLPFPSAWLISYLMMRFLPNIAFRAGEGGMLWELNRSTGIVSVRKHGFKAPFYEWDAYIHTFPGQSGVIFYRLYLIHRYQEYTIDLTHFSPASNMKEDAYAAWDFIQNYMDVSQPIPDIPLLEMWRAYDPKTAEYDQQTGRNPNYWLDMDDETWQQHEKEMYQQVVTIDTMQRADVMQSHLIDTSA